MTIVTGFTGGDYAYQMANATFFFLITILISLAPTPRHPRKERPLMSVQPALVAENDRGHRGPRAAPPQAGQAPASAMDRVNWPGTHHPRALRAQRPVPLYVTISMAFKTTGAGRLRQRLLAAVAVQRRRIHRPRGASPTSRSGVRDLGARHRGLRSSARSCWRPSRPSPSPATGSAGSSAARSSTCSLAMFIPFPVLALPQIQLTGLAGPRQPGRRQARCAPAPIQWWRLTNRSGRTPQPLNSERPIWE